MYQLHFLTCYLSIYKGLTYPRRITCYCVVEYIECDICWIYKTLLYRGNNYSWYFSNSEASASELLENHEEEMFLRFLKGLRHSSLIQVEVAGSLQWLHLVHT